MQTPHNSDDPAREPDEADELLMQKVGQGNTDAFAVLVRRHQTPMVNFFHRMGVGKDAEDLAQEVFIRLFRYRDRYKASAKLTTFLYMIARQVRIDRLRKYERQRRLEDSIKDRVAIDASVVDSGRDLREAAVDALDTLSEEMRSVVVLSIFQGFKYREIAEILEIPEGTVKTRMFHTLRKLRETLQ